MTALLICAHLWQGTHVDWRTTCRVSFLLLPCVSLEMTIQLSAWWQAPLSPLTGLCLFYFGINFVEIVMIFLFFFKKNVFTYLCICVSIEVRGRYWIGLLELEPKWLEALCKCWCWKSNLDDLKQHPVLITTKHLSSPMILRPVLSPVQKVTVLSKGKYLLSLGLSEVSASGLKV